MGERRTKAWLGVTAAVIGVLQIGCASAPEAHPPRSVYVTRPPPEPLPEMKSGPAAPGMAWVGGYWHYNGTDYVWIPGHWETPEAGAVWRPPAVVYSSSRRAWVYEHGRWEPVEARGLR